MQNLTDEIIGGYKLLFKDDCFNLGLLHKKFVTSEFYEPGTDIRSYYLPDYLHDIEFKTGDNLIKEETFSDYLLKHLHDTEESFKVKVFQMHGSAASRARQDALLFTIIAEFLHLIAILTSAENEKCKPVLESIEACKSFLISSFASQLELKDGETSHHKKKTLSSFYRGIEKLEFNLQKNEIALLFLMLKDSKILHFPISDADIARFLDNNVKYYNSNTEKHEEIKNSKTELSRLRDQGSQDDKQRRSILDRLNVQIKRKR